MFIYPANIINTPRASASNYTQWNYRHNHQVYSTARETSLYSRSSPYFPPFCSTVEACPVDVKRHVLENILLCGGGAELRGILYRITIELR